tara:strand:- start:21147 stop:21392 length:246 start_codon:yes stop_codon:yes gene_type:complete
MEYKGKLYGKIGNKYFDTSYTSEDYDNLVKENKELKKQLSLNAVMQVKPEKVCEHDLYFRSENTCACRNCDFEHKVNPKNL